MVIEIEKSQAGFNVKVDGVLLYSDISYEELIKITIGDLDKN